MFRFALLLLGATTFAGAQDRPNPDLYQGFFRQVFALKSIGDHPTARLANGDIVPMKVPTLQEAIGLTDEEVGHLNTTAADCLSQLSALDRTSSALIFESRLQSADTGKISDALALEMKNLEARRNKLVVDHVLDLKTALPPAAFEKLDAYVRAPAAEKKSLTPYFESAPGPTLAPKKQ